MSGVFVLVPAAGSSSRMAGGDKLLEEVDGLPMLARQVGIALATGAHVGVTFDPAGQAQRLKALGLVADPRIMAIPVPDAAGDMAASLRRGVAAAETVVGDARPDGMMVLPADMPDLTAADLAAVVAAFAEAPDSVVRGAAADGIPGHPVILPRRLFGSVASLSGDEGARSLVKKETAVLVPLPGLRALTDLDTPEDWATWRAERRLGPGD